MKDNEELADQVRDAARRIAESGAPALAALYDLASRRLLRFAITITRNQHDAEDALQATLLKVAGNPLLLAQAQAPWAYLLRMVRNESLLVVRKRKRLAPLGSIIDLLTRRCVDRLEREDTYRVIWHELRALPVEQSEVVVLKIWEDLTFAEIADVLELPLQTVASRYRYGLNKLSKRLGPAGKEVHDAV